MLSLHPQPGRLRAADNLVPTKEGGMASRPAANQIVAGDIAQGAAWGNRALLEKNGRLVVWDGSGEYDVGPAGHQLVASSFQALTANAARQDRLYVADGISLLWYVARTGGAYVRTTVQNTVLDANNQPYAIPIPTTIATWRGRLFIGYGGNRVQHCQFDDPAYWDPLWTVELQGPDPDRVVALEPDGARLLAGLVNSVWQITGDSHYNWQRDSLADVGAAGPNALGGGYVVSAKGVHRLGTAEPVSADLREAFEAPVAPGELVLDPRRRLVLVLLMGRLFVTHLDSPGRWGEIKGFRIAGLLQLADYTGWYGADGAWLLGARDMADAWLDGTRSNFTSLYDSWEDIPNVNGRGRAKLTRTRLVVRGSTRANATYTATNDEGTAVTVTATLSDEYATPWADDVAGLNGQLWPTASVRRDLPVNLAGRTFRHQLSAPCHLEVLEFEPVYKFGGGEE